MIILRVILFPIKVPIFLFFLVCMPFMVSLDRMTSPDNDSWDELWLQEFRKAIAMF